jgi:hypothetical protein
MAGKGTKDEPWTGSSVWRNALKGPAAVREVEKRYGIQLTAPQKRIVELEGFVPGFYMDDAKQPVLTYGVGQTGEYIDKGFVAAYEHHQGIIEQGLGPLKQFSEKLQGELMSLVYRGDYKHGYNWVRQFNEGRFEDAADTLLIHREYMDRKKANPDDGVVKRLEAAADAIRNAGKDVLQSSGVNLAGVMQ